MNTGVRIIIFLSIILAVFLIGLIGYYRYSADGEDGLEKTMSDNDVSEGEPVIKSPLDYGEKYFQSAVMGILGGSITGILVYAMLKILKYINTRFRKEIKTHTN
ncbi:MAG: hypothetical protein QW728_03035 [Thermoplasmata archaeon]